MEELSFEVGQEALTLVRNTEISANFAECKEYLRDMIAPYKTMVVTEDDIATAKDNRAKIRKIANRIDESRKMVKKIYSEPLAKFEAECKELVAICEEGSNNLDKQVREYEQRERDAKIEQLQQHYYSIDTDAKHYLPWTRLFNERWGNKGYSLEEAKNEITDALERVAQDLETIRGVGGKNTAYLLDVYKNTLDLNAAIRKNAELKAAQEAEERRAQEREAQKRAEMEESVRASREAARINAMPAAPAQETSFAEDEPDEVDDPFVECVFKVRCRKSQLVALGAYMKQSGVSYGRA